MSLEEFVKKALDIFHQVQQDVNPNEFNQQTKKLYETIERTSLHKLISLDDLRWAIRDDMFFRWSTTIKNVNDDTFIERFKFTILTTKTYDFYAPIYCLYGFPKNMSLANSTVLHFQDLPVKVQEHYLSRWRFRFQIDKENYHNKEDDYVNLKKSSTFLHLIINANGKDKAMEEAKNSAEDVLHIIRFVYDLNFNLIDIDYWVRDNGESGGVGLEGLAGLPFCGRAQYIEILGKSLKIISDIFGRKNSCDIEKRVKRAVRIFGTQETITNTQVRFLLLMTCLESLLMSEYDKDYILWRLAEKTAFVLGGDMRKINDEIRDAYRKRSSFIHGSSKEVKPITDDDIANAKQIVGDLIWKLIIEFVNKGYTKIAKDGDQKKQIKSIDEYIEQMKFPETQSKAT